MIWKPRWIAKAVSWKLFSAVLGAVVVYFMTGDFSSSAQYITWYVPISLMLFIAHEKVWHMGKLRSRRKRMTHEAS